MKMKDVKAGNAYDMARGPAEGSPGLYWDTAEALLNGPGKGLLKPCLGAGCVGGKLSDAVAASPRPWVSPKRRCPSEQPGGLTGHLDASRG